MTEAYSTIAKRSLDIISRQKEKNKTRETQFIPAKFIQLL